MWGGGGELDARRRGGGVGLGIFPLSDRADKGHERMRRAWFGEREREAGWVPCVGEH